MPINIPDALPAKDILESEKIFAIEDKSAHRQRIRPVMHSLKLIVKSEFLFLFFWALD